MVNNIWNGVINQGNIFNPSSVSHPVLGNPILNKVIPMSVNSNGVLIIISSSYSISPVASARGAVE